MAILTHTCPHPDCGVHHIGLIIVATHYTGFAHRWAAHLVCPKCSLPACAILEPTGPSGDFQAATSGSGDVLDRGWEIKEFWPEPPKPIVPELIHPDITRVYLQAERNYPTAGNEEAAGTMYGKALDIALKKIDPSLSGMLGPRIKALAAQGKLTTNIAEWSDSVRAIRNEAVHDETPISREDLADLRNFTEMLLRYLFTLPNMVRKRRGERLEWEPLEGATA